MSKESFDITVYGRRYSVSLNKRLPIGYLHITCRPWYYHLMIGLEKLLLVTIDSYKCWKIKSWPWSRKCASSFWDCTLDIWKELFEYCLENNIDLLAISVKENVFSGTTFMWWFKYDTPAEKITSFNSQIQTLFAKCNKLAWK